MLSASEGGRRKSDVVREVAWILVYKSGPNTDKGEGAKKSENYADIISGSSLVLVT